MNYLRQKKIKWLFDLVIGKVNLKCKKKLDCKKYCNNPGLNRTFTNLTHNGLTQHTCVLLVHITIHISLIVVIFKKWTNKLCIKR